MEYDLLAYPVLKVIQGWDLEKETKAGWVVLRILEEDAIFATTDKLVESGVRLTPAGSVNNIDYMPPISKSLLGKQHKYLIGLDEARSRESFSALLGKALATQEELRKQLTAEEMACKEFKTKYEAFANVSGQWQVQFDRQKQDAEVKQALTQAMIQKLEETIAVNASRYAERLNEITQWKEESEYLKNENAELKTRLEGTLHFGRDLREEGEEG